MAHGILNDSVRLSKHMEKGTNGDSKHKYVVAVSGQVWSSGLESSIV